MFPRSGEIDSSPGDVMCRRVYWAMRVPYAFNARESDAVQTCLQGMPTNRLTPDPEQVRRVCGLIAESFRKPAEEVCARSGLGLSAAACVERLGEKHGDPAACAKIKKEATERTELCAGVAAFNAASRAKDPALCGGSDVCRLFMGQGDAVLAERRAALEREAAATGPRDAEEKPDRSGDPRDAREALAQLDYSNADGPARIPASDTEARVDLGRHLFFDKRLSVHKDFSCASCHLPDKAWTDGLPRGRGAGGRTLPRRTPSLLKVAYYDAFMWDGRARTLEAQALLPLQNPAEMGISLDELARRLRAVPEYRRRFKEVDGTEEITAELAARSLAAFVRRIGASADDSPFERFRSDPSALTDAQKRGFVVFMGKGRCVLCHVGRKLTYDAFLNTGLRDPGKDPGRYAIAPEERLRGAFRTPTLFDAALTPPYMHDGSLATLKDVVDFYDRGGDDKEHASPEIRPLGLTPEESADLVSFLQALTRPPRPIEPPAAFPD